MTKDSEELIARGDQRKRIAGKERKMEDLSPRTRTEGVFTPKKGTSRGNALRERTILRRQKTETVMIAIACEE